VSHARMRHIAIIIGNHHFRLCKRSNPIRPAADPAGSQRDLRSQGERNGGSRGERQAEG